MNDQKVLTAKEVRNVIRKLQMGDILLPVSSVISMLTAYAERIKADEGAVTDDVVEIAVREFRKAYATDGVSSLSKITFDAMRATLLAVWPNPPAQAAQVGAEKVRDVIAKLNTELGESDRFSRIRVSTVRFYLNKLTAALTEKGNG